MTPSNPQPSDATPQEPPSDIRATDETQSVPMGGRELDGDFKMTEEEFDSVLEDCSHVRDTPVEKEQKVSPTLDLAGGDPDL